jgi:hypothetical protein
MSWKHCCLAGLAHFATGGDFFDRFSQGGFRLRSASLNRSKKYSLSIALHLLHLGPLYLIHVATFREHLVLDVGDETYDTGMIKFRHSKLSRESTPPDECKGIVKADHYYQK